MQIAIEIGNAELVTMSVEGDFRNLGRGRQLLVLLVRRESVTRAPVPEFDDAFVRSAQILKQVKLSVT